jgi:hypothetical protein
MTGFYDSFVVLGLIDLLSTFLGLIDGEGLFNKFFLLEGEYIIKLSTFFCNASISISLFLPNSLVIDISSCKASSLF